MILRKIKDFLPFFLAGDDSFSLENRLFLNTIIIGIAASLLGSIVSIIISSSITTVIISLSQFFLLLILYYFVKVKRILQA